MQNNYYNNPQYPMYGGQAYGIAKPQAANSQPLTAEIANSLRQDANNLDMKIDQNDIYRAMCTHKDPSTGQNTLAQNPDGSYTCSICGATFNMFEGTTEEIKRAVKTIVDMFQTCKTIYLDAPIEMTKQYYQQICLLNKFPALWDHAVRNFSKYEYAPNPMNPISSQYGGFNALSNLLTNPWMMPQQMGYQQPMYGQQPMMQPMQQQMGYQQPMYGQQPMMQPAVNPGTNPMAYGVPAAPVAPMPGVMPEAQNAAPAAPAPQNGEIQQQKVFNV